MRNRLTLAGVTAGIALMLASCSSSEIAPPALRPLSGEAMMLLGKKGMSAQAPIFIRIFKEESELEVWKARDDGHFYHFKTYPICNWSGDLGPKIVQGDRQAPEGFYTIHKSQMNPNSGFHLAFNLGYPNAYDRANGRTGSALMVHGKCKSAGCYAMTDALIEEIFALAREQFAAGHDSFQVHAFPFRMTDANLARQKGHQWYDFWRTLKQGYDAFETSRTLPPVAICERRYHVNVRLKGGPADPLGRCPPLERLIAEPFNPQPTTKTATAEAHIVAKGPKMRALASSGTGGLGGTMSGLLNAPAASAAPVGFGLADH